MKFVAKTKGYYGDRLINAGEEFDADDDFSGKWAVPAEKWTPEQEKTEEDLVKDAVEGLQGAKNPKKVAKKKAAKKAAAKE